MSVSHIQRQRANAPSSVDITGAQMVMVMKLTAFCWNVWDGKQDQAGLNEYQRDRALTSLPDPLDFAAFVAFFPSLMAGPAFDFADYRRWLETTMFDLPPGTDPAKAPPTRKQRRIPRSGTPAMWKLATGLVWILAFLQLSAYFNEGVVQGPRYSTFSFPWRVFHMYMMNLVARMKYYGVWTLTEGACIMAGIGYKGLDPKTGKHSWDRLTNIRPLGVELAQNTHAYLGNWNINTNNWLRNYMYLRVTPKGKKPGFRATLATFVTSAFWHGFYPGYYLAFVLAAFMQNTAKSKLTHPPSPSSTNQVRRPPPPPPLLPHPRRHQTPPHKTLLRHPLLGHNPNHLLLRHNPLHPPHAPGLPTRLGPSLLLRHHRRLALRRFHRLSRQTLVTIQTQSQESEAGWWRE